MCGPRGRASAAASSAAAAPQRASVKTCVHAARRPAAHVVTQTNLHAQTRSVGQDFAPATTVELTAWLGTLILMSVRGRGQGDVRDMWSAEFDGLDQPPCAGGGRGAGEVRYVPEKGLDAM